MKKAMIAMAIVTLVSLMPGAAFASSTTSTYRGGDGHGGDGHGMDMGGHDDANVPTVDGAREIKVTAGRFRFTPKEITIAAGEDVTIVMKSTDLFHDFVVKGTGHVVGAKRKKTAMGGLRIDEPGTYKFWCSVKGHRAAGMKGTLVVE